MTIGRRAFLSAMPILLLLLGPAEAAPKRSWDGVWSGLWGGSASQATSITIVNNRVVSYQYQGASNPVAASNVTPTTITYEDRGVSIVIKRTGDATATASLHSSQGDATAQLTRR